VAPVDYKVREPHPERWYLPASDEGVMAPLAHPILDTGREVLAYICVHTFGLRMLYPGSVALLKSLLQPQFVKNRSLFLSMEVVNSGI